MNLSCCCDVGPSCGFTDEDFSSAAWNDPDEMIQGGDVQGDLDTENTRVTTEIQFRQANSFRISARVSVSDGSGNWAGMEIVDADGYDCDLIIESTGTAATDVIVRGHGTADKETNDQYLLVIEFIIANLAAPLINFWVNDELVDSQLVTGDIPTEGTLRLTAFTSAKVLGVSIDCPPVGVDCGLCSGASTGFNAAVFPGTTDERPFPPPHQQEQYSDNGNGLNSQRKTTVSWPISGPHKLKKLILDPAFFSGCWFGRLINDYEASWSIADNPAFNALNEVRAYVSITARLNRSAVPWQITGQDIDSSFADVQMAAGFYAIAQVDYEAYEQNYILTGPINLAFYRWTRQRAVWAKKIAEIGEGPIDCVNDVANVELPLVAEFGSDLDFLNANNDDLAYRGNFTAGSTATLLFQP